MKKVLVSILCLIGSLSLTCSVFAANEGKYPRDGVTFFVEEQNGTAAQEPVTEENMMVYIKYTDGTVVAVPSHQLDVYKALGWIQTDETRKDDSTEYVAVYNYKGETKKISASQLEIEKAKKWFPAFDEAIYDYVMFGDGKDVPGVTTLLEQEKYETAFLMVQDALAKLENTDSRYVNALYYLRSSITTEWRYNVDSPIGFINSSFLEMNGKKYAVLEFRNISNSRIQAFSVNFDICNKNGAIIEINRGSYYIDKLEMTPCNKKKVAWEIKSGDAASVKNIVVKEVIYSDGNKWNAAVK